MKPPKMIDSKRNGSVAGELREHIGKGSKLSIVTAYFTIYAFAELKKELLKVESVRMLFTDPVIIKNDNQSSREYYIEHPTEQAITGNQYEIKLRNEMCQASVARECAQWLEHKAQIKMFKAPNSAQPCLVYIDNGADSISINGTVDFTTEGLVLTPSSRVDSNLCIYGSDCTRQFLKMFVGLWNDDSAVEDIKDEVLRQVQVLYKEDAPQFIYFVTLYGRAKAI